MNNQKVFDALENAAKLAVEHKEKSVASILYALMGACTVDCEYVLGEHVNVFSRQFVAELKKAKLAKEN